MTIYLKSTLAGVLAVATAGIGLVGLFAMIARLLGGDVRPGVELGWKTGVTAILLFALGFAWQYRRASKPAARPDKTVSGSASARRG